MSHKLFVYTIVLVAALTYHGVVFSYPPKINIRTYINRIDHEEIVCKKAVSDINLLVDNILDCSNTKNSNELNLEIKFDAGEFFISKPIKFHDAKYKSINISGSKNMSTTLTGAISEHNESNEENHVFDTGYEREIKPLPYITTSDKSIIKMPRWPLNKFVLLMDLTTKAG